MEEFDYTCWHVLTIPMLPLVRSGGRSSDVVVQDLALDILRVLPETVEEDDDDDGRQGAPRPGQVARPTILDIVNIGSGLYFKLKKRDSAKHSKGMI